MPIRSAARTTRTCRPTSPASTRPSRSSTSGAPGRSATAPRKTPRTPRACWSAPKAPSPAVGLQAPAFAQRKPHDQTDLIDGYAYTDAAVQGAGHRHHQPVRGAGAGQTAAAMQPLEATKFHGHLQHGKTTLTQVDALDLGRAVPAAGRRPVTARSAPTCAAKAMASPRTSTPPRSCWRPGNANARHAPTATSRPSTPS